MKQNVLVNGVYFETLELNERQFEIAIKLFTNPLEVSKSYSIKDASDFINEWLETDSSGYDGLSLDEEYVEWLIEMMKKGAEIYTLLDEWQEIGEIAVIR